MTTIDLDELLENLAQCRRCGICRNAVYEDKGFDGVCPVWKNSAGFETSFMRGRIQVALALLDGRLEKTEENAESLFSCTLCGNCTSICAAEFDPAKCLESVREVLNEIPNAVRDTIAKKILENNNPYVDENKTRRDWVKEVGFDIPGTGEVLYFTGCTAGLKLPETAKSTAKVLNAAGVNFAVLEEEPCCGSVMIRTGMVEEAKKNAEKALEMIAKSGAKKIVVTCAGCLKTLREDYSERFGLDVPEVLHMVEYLKPLIESGKLKLKKSSEIKKITWHDPCHLGRALGVYEEPRDILKAIPGVELVEMETNREAAMCCGSGGGLRSYDGNLAKKIASDRIQDAEAIDADILATACPFCEHNLKDGANRIGSKIRVVDILDLISKQLQ
ncbi:(Fe-S)-binding protein [Candidatus Thorarchaeota archaeon]|nr:MAG: (Fe-S)-binding protein [Candidatus Thorarchaeota archaeon]